MQLSCTIYLMKKIKLIPPPLTLKAGTIIEEEYSTYKDLFEETPSETLKRSFDHDKAFTGECVERKEELV